MLLQAKDLAVVPSRDFRLLPSAALRCSCCPRQKNIEIDFFKVISLKTQGWRREHAKREFVENTYSIGQNTPLARYDTENRKFTF